MEKLKKVRTRARCL